MAVESNERPNVVFILADDLGYGDLSCYGATKIQTPHMDSIAKHGRQFTDAHSPSSVCTPSRYNLLTGRYAFRTWAKSSTVWANDPLLIEPDRFTLADLFKRHGYRTAIIGKWHLGFGAPGMEGWNDVLGPDYNRPLRPGPLDLGFDSFWGFPHVGQLPHIIIKNDRVVGLSPDDPIRITPDPRPGYEKDFRSRPRLGTSARLGVKGGQSATYQHEQLASRLTDQATRYIADADDDQPFFLYVAHRNIHGPLKSDPRFRGRTSIGPYGDFVMELDESVGKILGAIEQKGISNNTLVILTSDNGGIVKYEPIRYAQVNGHRPNGVLRGQKTDAYEGGVRVPFIARWPGVIPPGTRDDSLIALTDMIASFAEFFGDELPDGNAEDSVSCWQAIIGAPNARPTRDTLICDSYAGVMSVRKGHWKLIFSQHGGGAGKKPIPYDAQSPEGQLFDLSNDVAESENLYQSHPDKVAELSSIMQNIIGPKANAMEQER